MMGINRGQYRVDVKVTGTQKKFFGIILQAIEHHFSFAAASGQEVLDRVDLLCKHQGLVCTEVEYTIDQSVLYITLKNDTTTMRFTAVEVVNDYKVNCGGIMYSSELKIF